mmetsp:Transcript_13819/g.15752  ORF Transcript_13819/g.15752 Transcript_13819/m.15752 type:complete len:226 (-) Transcript_13819:1849-2526(-)
MAKKIKKKQKKRGKVASSNNAGGIVFRTGPLEDKHLDPEAGHINLVETDTSAGGELKRQIVDGHVREPVLASFPQGCIPSASEPFGVFRSTNARRGNQRLIYGRTDKVEYKGKNFGPIDRSTGKLSRYLVFKYDQERNEAVLLNRNKANQSIFEMRQTVLKVKEASEQAVEKEEMTMRERRRKLVNSFGSKKKKKRIKSMDANKISSGQVISASALESVLEKSVN